VSDASTTPQKPILVPADNAWAHRWKITAGVAIVGAVLAGLGAAIDGHRFAFSWLFAFAAVMTMALGAMFFVLIQHLTGAAWSVTVRRSAEFYAYGARSLFVLFIPVVLCVGTLYPWWNEAQSHGDHAAQVEAGHGEHGAEHGEAHGAGHVLRLKATAAVTTRQSTPRMRRFSRRSWATSTQAPSSTSECFAISPFGGGWAAGCLGFLQSRMQPGIPS